MTGVMLLLLVAGALTVLAVGVAVLALVCSFASTVVGELFHRIP